ncbi:uncharacterized protein LOC143179672 [Calliopsis andreniformis]|uniref:uncharacterized protein LOC143179672 n=1 Tax=Calliopsis andreniformis TaxID=337506 RepID=UPI003FCD5628
MSLLHTPTKSDATPTAANMADTPEGASVPAVEPSVSAAILQKLPPFWKENPTLWFAQVEATFQLARITTDDTKYRYIITHLDHTVLPFIADVLTSPPATGKFEEIKRRIINTFDESPESKLRRLLRGSELGDEKPSHFLQRLRNLAGGQVGETVLRSLFLEQLPENVRSIIAISDTADLQRFALLADKVVKMSAPRVAAVETPNMAPSDRVSALEEKMAKLVDMVETLSMRQSRQADARPRASWRRRSSSREGRPPFRSRSHEGRGGLCHYHRRFAERAHRCVIPCGWTGPPPTAASSGSATTPQQGN